ncbi:MAG: dockerin type I domain-containing protein [Tepidisphaeraceae bacterium]
MYLGPEDRYTSYNPVSGVLLHPNDVVAFYLMAGGQSMNQPVQIGDAGTITIGGINTSGTVTFNDFFKTLPTDGNGIINGASQTIYFSAAAGGTVLQNFALIRGGGGGYCGASVDKIGPGTWIVAGGGDNNAGEQAYYGTTTVRDGTLELAYDDTGTNYVTLPAAAISAGAPYYQSGNNGGSLGYNAPTNANVQLDTNAVQLGDSGTLSTDNIALLTLGFGYNSGTGQLTAPRQVLHNISVNNDNPSGTTSIGVGDNDTANFSGNILLYKSVVLASGTGGTANFTGNVTGTGAITVNGTGTVNLSGVNTYNGATNVTSGAALVIAAAGALPSGTTIVNNGSLTVNGSVVTGNISGTGTLNIGVASTTVLKLASGTLGSSQGALSISTGSTLDITNNHMYINYGSGSDPLSTIAGYIKSGYNGGGWNGPGIIASAAQTKTNGLSYGVGYADGKDGKVSGLSSGQIEVAYTLLGDANLDGLVNAADFTILAANFNQPVTAWDQGDFNYDGLVNAADFTDLAANFNQSASGADVSAGDVAALDAFAAANGLSLPASSVPEPATAGLIGMVGVGLLHRRRRA